MKPTPKILWIIQTNQTTPIILEYFKTLQTRVERQIDLIFWVPDTSAGELDRLKALNPFVYKTATRAAAFSSRTYQAKREALNKECFSQGLLISDTLLLDDFGGANAQMTTLEVGPPDNTCGIIIQVPSPMGSSEVEEKNFHAAILWARQHKIPVIGYELLPLDTKWTLAPSLPDGIITRYPESYEYLKDQLDHNNIWQIPPYEAAIFTSIATSFHLNGVKASYHYRNTYAVPADRTVLYLPHNVAMIYEYKRLIQILSPFGKNLHLMFSAGKDQVRGGYTHEQMIEMVYKKELQQMASYSFHDMNSSWEMMMADALVACSTGFTTLVGEKELPCIIFDPLVPEASRGNKRRVQTKEKLLDLVEEQINCQKSRIELADIMMLLVKTRETNA